MRKFFMKIHKCVDYVHKELFWIIFFIAWASWKDKSLDLNTIFNTIYF